jgi:hypothetical protein
MTTFRGCDSEQMAQLAELIRQRAAVLEDQQHVCVRAGDVNWQGADAEDFRTQTHIVASLLGDLRARLESTGNVVRGEFEEQDRVSTADADLIDGIIPYIAGPMGLPAGTSPFPSFDAPDDFDIRPYVGGPLAAPLDPDFPDSRPDAPLDPPLGDGSGPGLGPWFGGPMGERIGEDGTIRGFPLPTPQPVPRPAGGSGSGSSGSSGSSSGTDDEPWLRPEDLQRASKERHAVVGKIPILAQAQEGVDTHARTGDRIDRWEETAQQHGLGPVTRPVFTVARINHSAEGAVFGDDSVLGQGFEEIDRKVANGSRTIEEVGGAVADGDLPGAARALETGMAYETSSTVRLVTTTAPSAVTGAAGDVLGGTADLLEPVAPSEVTDTVRGAGEAIASPGAQAEQWREDATDPESWIEKRRQYAPMPWDEDPGSG